MGRYGSIQITLPETKQCSRCEFTKPGEEFRSFRHKNGAIYFDSYCKSCLRAKAHDRSRRLGRKVVPRQEYIVYGYRRCPACKELKQLSAFSPRTSYCLPCKSIKRDRFYGLAPYEYDKMFYYQDGKCGICPNDLVFRHWSTHIDHDHQTGVVRGLLCHNCNKGLGNFKDNQKVLGMAIQYLSSS